MVVPSTTHKQFANVFVYAHNVLAAEGNDNKMLRPLHEIASIELFEFSIKLQKMRALFFNSIAHGAKLVAIGLRCNTVCDRRKR